MASMLAVESCAAGSGTVHAERARSSALKQERPTDRSGQLVEQHEAMVGQRWAASYNLRIAVYAPDQPARILTSGHRDFKPVWSKTGSLLAFFRTLHESSNPGSSPDFTQWKTKLCVIGADGSGLEELTSGDFADFNPTWTRDGSNRILFNRYGVASADSDEIYVIAPDGALGSELRISNPAYRYEWADSALKDGRIFVDRTDFRAPGGPTMQSFLLTPRPGRVGIYEEISRPDPRLWQKLSVSPSETKVAYMLDGNGDPASFNDDVLYVADFDPIGRKVSNAVAFTGYDPSCINEYPRWSADETLILYDSSCHGTYQMFTYRLKDGVTARLSNDPTGYFMFGNFENIPP
jgi:Tol biopolymer transport system component